MGRYAEAYPDLFRQHDERVERLVEQVLGNTKDGGLVPRQDVADLVDRISGRISFEEYLTRGRAADRKRVAGRRTAPSPSTSAPTGAAAGNHVSGGRAARA